MYKYHHTFAVTTAITFASFKSVMSMRRMVWSDISTSLSFLCLLRFRDGALVTTYTSHVRSISWSRGSNRAFADLEAKG